jgi:hypothetical protein
MMFGMFNICLHNDDQICGKFARAFIIRENVMACTNITMKLYIAAAATLCAHSP